MATIHHFTQFLFSLDPQTNAARLSLFNFLRNFFDGASELNEEIINRFIRRSLSYQYWQERKKELSHEIFFITDSFNTRIRSQGKQLLLNLKKIAPCEDFQLVKLEGEKQSLKILENHFLETGKSADGELSIIVCDPNLTLVLHRLGDQGLRVNPIENLFYIYEGLLKPLNDDLHLDYDPKLELKRDCLQQIGLTNSLIARFTISGPAPLAHGSLMRDYSFQKYEMMTGIPLVNTRVWPAIKRLEQYYIDPKSEYPSDKTPPPLIDELISNQTPVL
ncbi:MAG: hypothetical protein SGJ18_04370 [Pseudomonadota bacterium]|nr:hypothetical protein [Pseudomonadota bacterium]